MLTVPSSWVSSDDDIWKRERGQQNTAVPGCTLNDSRRGILNTVYGLPDFHLTLNVKESFETAHFLDKYRKDVLGDTAM